MTVKHTPGPWSLNIEDGRAEVCVDGERLTDPYIGDENARLIAAAPEMLEALKLILEHCNNNVEVGTVGERVVERVEETALSAIAKAEGRS